MENSVTKPTRLKYEKILIAIAILLTAILIISLTVKANRPLTFAEKAETETHNENKICLNSATEADLTTLEGIGKVKAANIVKYRTENGSFSTIDEIKEVDGIGDKTFEKLKDYICV